MALSLALVAALVFAAVLVLAAGYAPGHGASAAITAAVARHTARWRVGGFLAGLCCAGLAAIGGLRPALLVGAPLFAVCAMSGVLAGELTAPVSRQPVRVAHVVRRRLTDYLPVRATLVLAGLGGALTLLLAASAAVGGALAQPDPGCTNGPVPVGGPRLDMDPGVSVATLIIVLAGSALAAWTLRVVVRRPRTAAGDAARAGDDVLRRHSAQAVLAGWGVLVTAPAAATAASMAASLFNGCPDAVTMFANWLLTLVAIAVAVGMVACLAWLGSRTWQGFR